MSDLGICVCTENRHVRILPPQLKCLNTELGKARDMFACYEGASHFSYTQSPSDINYEKTPPRSPGYTATDQPAA